MPTVYKSGEPIPFYNGNVKGGVSVLLEKPDDLNDLRALVLLAPQVPEEPIKSIHKALADPDLNLDMWRKWAVKLERPNHPEFFTRNFESDIKSINELILSIKTAWQQQIQNKEEIGVIFTVRDPGDTEELQFESVNPALVIYQGSTNFILKYSAKTLLLVTKFTFAIFSKAPSLVHADFVKLLREQKINEGKSLANLAEQTAESINTKTIVVIFLHGLVSTDVGTFDTLIDNIKSANASHNVGFYGWPHDSLASIDSNAQTLSGIIGNKLFKDAKKPYPKIMFIAHSRGGLVARATAIKLYKRHSDKYTDILQHLFTFGTPHEGSALVEKPAEFKSIFVASQFFKVIGFMPSFTQLLELFGNPEEFPGIMDLIPRTAKPNSFIGQLRDNEEQEAQGTDKARTLKIHAVGGVVQEDTDKPAIKKFVDRIMGKNNHDLAVSTASSIDSENNEIGLEECWEWKCDHFNYFNELQIPQFYIVTDLIKKIHAQRAKQEGDKVHKGLDDAVSVPANPPHFKKNRGNIPPDSDSSDERNIPPDPDPSDTPDETPE